MKWKRCCDVRNCGLKPVIMGFAHNEGDAISRQFCQCCHVHREVAVSNSVYTRDRRQPHLRLANAGRMKL